MPAAVFGHWHSDPECAYFEESKKNKEKGTFLAEHEQAEEDEEHATFVVGQASSEDDADGEDDGDAFIVHGTGLGQSSLREESAGIGLSDTCCAKSVVGQKWLADHVLELKKRGLPFTFHEEREPFRFGGGPKIMSSQAIILPLFVKGCNMWVALKAGVVDRDVPLLISRGALKAVGMIMDLVNSRMTLKELGCSTELVTTSTGHVGFRILHPEAPPWKYPAFWGAIKKGCEQEIFFGKFGGGKIIFRTRSVDRDSDPCEHPEPSVFMESCQEHVSESLSKQVECGSDLNASLDGHGQGRTSDGGPDEGGEDDGAQAQGRVRQCDRREEQHRAGCSPGHDGGSTPGGVSHPSIQERGRPFENRMEEGQCRDAQGPVRGACGALLHAQAGQSLARDDAKRAHPRA